MNDARTANCTADDARESMCTYPTQRQFSKGECTRMCVMTRWNWRLRTGTKRVAHLFVFSYCFQTMTGGLGGGDAACVVGVLHSSLGTGRCLPRPFLVYPTPMPLGRSPSIGENWYQSPKTMSVPSGGPEKLGVVVSARRLCTSAAWFSAPSPRSAWPALFLSPAPRPS